jgi:hypothetical protein
VTGFGAMTVYAAIRRFVERGCNIDVRKQFNCKRFAPKSNTMSLGTKLKVVDFLT